jgi:tetratricopeptide (TPR) repeat protein
MAVVSLVDNKSRTSFFEKTISVNLEYWLEWLSQIKDIDADVVKHERNSIVRAILFALDLGETTWPMTHQLIKSFSSYMERRGHWDVWYSVLRRAIGIAVSVGDKNSVVDLSALLARLLFQQSYFKQARHYYRQTIRMARQTGDKFNEARACSNLGYYYVEHGQWLRAEVLCCHALKIFAQIGSDHGVAHTENHLGCLYTRQEQWGKAEQHLKQACATWQQMDDKHGLMRGHINLSLLYVDTHRPDEALTSLTKALVYAQLTGDELTIGTSYLNIGFAYRLKKEYAEAEAYIWKAETIFQHHTNVRGLALVQDNLGLIYLEQQIWQQAESYLKTALAAWRELDSKYNEIQVIIYLAELEIARSDLQQATTWLDKAAQLLARYDRAKRFRPHWRRLREFRRSLNEGILIKPRRNEFTYHNLI